MSPPPLSYAIISPTQNESRNLPRLARSITRQTVTPRSWIVVDTGSSDTTREVATALAERHSWIRSTSIATLGEPPRRGARIVYAFEAALAHLDPPPNVVVKVDADVSFDADYFERLLAAFEADPSLGMASGSAFEFSDGDWRQRHVTGGSVWGASRAYRWECLQDVVPLEARIGWDGIDEMKAKVRGWRTRTLTDLPFLHHRREGERDGSPLRAWEARGHAAWFMGYRSWYLALRALHHARAEPAAMAMIVGYLVAAARRRPVWADEAGRALLRAGQSPRQLRKRRLEALGHTSQRGGDVQAE